MYKNRVLLISITILILINICDLSMKNGPFSTAGAQSLRNVFQQVNPAVVVVVTREGGFSRSIPNMPVIRGNLGSGIVVSKDGLIMTAEHVVHVADKVIVHFLDGSQIPAKVISSAQQADVAILKLNYLPDDLHVVEIGNSDLVEIGDEVFVVGAPYGIDHTLTVGHLSGRRKTMGVCNQITPIEFLQTDAGINVGNSGGPLFSIDGKLIGIVSHILSKSGGSEGLGFAVSINTAKSLLMEKETIWTGLEASLITGDLAKALNVPQEAGLLIQRVAFDSLAYKSGLKAGIIPIAIGENELYIGGDIILEVNGISISPNIQDTCDIRDRIGKKEKGGYTEFKILREGKIITLNIPE
jgi:serine protease Do